MFISSLRCLLLMQNIYFGNFDVVIKYINFGRLYALCSSSPWYAFRPRENFIKELSLR